MPCMTLNGTSNTFNFRTRAFKAVLWLKQMDRANSSLNGLHKREGYDDSLLSVFEFAKMKCSVALRPGLCRAGL